MMRVFCLALGLLLSVASWAQERTPSDWLDAMVQAVKETPYTGRLLYMSGARLSTMEVAHANFDGKPHERVVHLDDSRVELIRVGDEMVCIRADGMLTRLKASADSGPMTAKAKIVESLPAHYQVASAGTEQVAGREAVKVKLIPEDNYRFAYSVWVDHLSALPLKVETVNNHGQALERLEFVTINTNPNLSQSDFQLPESFKELALAPTDPSSEQNPGVSLGVNWLPPGFQQVETDVRQEQGVAVLAETYSDGIATFTLFVSSGEKTEVNASTVSYLGPTLVVESAVDAAGRQYSVTFIGEVPAATAEKVLSNLKLLLD